TRCPLAQLPLSSPVCSSSIRALGRTSGGTIMRMTSVAAMVCLAALGVVGVVQADTAARRPTNIPAQGLGPALQALARERGFQVVYLSDAVDALTTRGAAGEFTSDEALRQLLSGTGLSYRYLDANTVTIFKTNEAAVSSPKTSAAAGEPTAATQ